MKIGFSSGFAELKNFWGTWPWTKMYGGSEHIVVELAKELAAAGHEVVVRLPYVLDLERHAWGVRWISDRAPSESLDVLFAVDDYAPKDRAATTVLVACRSDPPRATHDVAVFLSKTHAAVLGHAGAPAIGGGVRITDYAQPAIRSRRKVIYTSSPDRGWKHAAIIAKRFDFEATYRGLNELSREDLIARQQTAVALIHPCDPVRPSEFFCMAVLEAMAAGTPCIVSDADALPELWGGAALVLHRPIDYGEWDDELERLIHDRAGGWRWRHERGLALAARYDWSVVAQRYLDLAKAA